MNDFWFANGHLGWVFFSLVVFSCVCLFVADMAWRMVAVRFYYLVLVAALTWLLGVALMVLLSV